MSTVPEDNNGIWCIVIILLCIIVGLILGA